MKRLTKHLTPSMAVACIALFLAAGGTGYAASQVVSGHAAKKHRAKKHRVKVRRGPRGLQGLVGPPGAAGSPGSPGATGPAGAVGRTGPAGANGTAGAAGPAGAPCLPSDPACVGPQGDPGPAGPSGLANIAITTSSPVSVPPGSSISSGVQCPTGQVATGGGVNLTLTPDPTTLEGSYPVSSAGNGRPDQWQAVVHNGTPAGSSNAVYRVYVICADG